MQQNAAMCNILCVDDPTRDRIILPVMHTSPLWNENTRHLVRIAAAVAGSTIAVVRRVMVEAKDAVDATQVEEVLLQSYLFAGFPRTLNAFTAWRELSGIAAPPNDALAATSNAPTWDAQGESTCRVVYGPVYESLRQNIRKLHPAIDLWMIADGYGKVLSRPGLDLARRELCIVAACAAAEQLPQLRSHLRGALNSGADVADLSATLSALSDVIPLSATTTARAELARLGTP
jgi:4-carboxymuconolactone decarboxylase